MKRYLLRRFLQSLLVICGISIVVFGVARLSGSPADLMVPMDAPRAERDRIVHEMGLDRPLPLQYTQFLVNAVQGDFGQSIRFNLPALTLVTERLPATAELALASLALGILVGVPLGVLAAVRYRSWMDLLVMTGTSLGQAIPSFWLGIMAILYFGLYLGWFPISGRDGATSLVLPAATLAVLPAVSVARLTRSALLSVLPMDYVRTAHAKGLSGRTVVFRHALRNALLPVVTLVGLQLGGLLSGAVITEQVFAWPGIGRLAIDSINARDFPVVQAVTMFSSTFMVFLNLLVDVAYTVLDPRIRLE